MKPRKRMRAISEKRLAQLGGKSPRSTLVAKTSIARKTSVKKRNSKRWKANHARAYGTADDIAAVNNEPCAHCGRWPSEMAHLRNGGAGRKADKELTLPLCTIRDVHDGCHQRFDKGKRSFRAEYLSAHGETMEATAERRWAEEDGSHG